MKSIFKRRFTSSQELFGSFSEAKKIKKFYKIATVLDPHPYSDIINRELEKEFKERIRFDKIGDHKCNK